MADPLRTVWDALEAKGCPPRGREWSFRASCPAHGGDSGNSLKVSEGSDGRAVLYCFVGCETEAVVKALGLRWADLFVGTSRVRSMPFSDLVLEGLRRRNIGYRQGRDGGFWEAASCPSCRLGRLWVADTDRGLRLSCANGCPADAILDVLGVAS